MMLRSRGDEVLFATGTFVVFFKANVASAVCTRHSRNALRWFKSHVDLRLLMFLELLKLWSRIFERFGGQPDGKYHPSLRVFFVDRPRV